MMNVTEIAELVCQTGFLSKYKNLGDSGHILGILLMTSVLAEKRNHLYSLLEMRAAGIVGGVIGRQIGAHLDDIDIGTVSNVDRVCPESVRLIDRVNLGQELSTGF